jgi:hypothetical protein
MSNNNSKDAWTELGEVLGYGDKGNTDEIAAQKIVEKDRGFNFDKYTVQDSQYQREIGLVLAGIAFERVRTQKYFEHDCILKIIDEWQMCWMSVTGTTEEDAKNYRRRAFGVDANMRHGLARMITEAFQKDKA